MPHVSERQPKDDDLRPQDKTDAPKGSPSGELGGEPINAHETAPRGSVPDSPEGGSPGDRHPDAVDSEPGSDL